MDKSLGVLVMGARTIPNDQVKPQEKMSPGLFASAGAAGLQVRPGFPLATGFAHTLLTKGGSPALDRSGLHDPAGLAPLRAHTALWLALATEGAHTLFQQPSPLSDTRCPLTGIAGITRGPLRHLQSAENAQLVGCPLPPHPVHVLCLCHPAPRAGDGARLSNELPLTADAAHPSGDPRVLLLRLPITSLSGTALAPCPVWPRLPDAAGHALSSGAALSRRQ